MAYSEKSSGEASKASEPDISGSYTVADYLNWQMEEMVELIRGGIYKMTPAPRSQHQIILGELHLQMAPRLKAQSCFCLTAPLDVFLNYPNGEPEQGENVVQPDLVVICKRSNLTERGCMGAPDLVVEILSPKTRQKDLTIKRDLYYEAGVPELWYVSTEERLIVQNVWTAKGYGEKTFSEGQRISSQKFPAVAIELRKLFEVLEK